MQFFFLKHQSILDCQSTFQNSENFLIKSILSLVKVSFTINVKTFRSDYSLIIYTGKFQSRLVENLRAQKTCLSSGENKIEEDHQGYKSYCIYRRQPQVYKGVNEEYSFWQYFYLLFYLMYLLLDKIQKSFHLKKLFHFCMISFLFFS